MITETDCSKIRNIDNLQLIIFNRISRRKYKNNTGAYEYVVDNIGYDGFIVGDIILDDLRKTNVEEND